jgi:anti-sigma regulatory factor (Ser/Thr protein kinase)
MAAMELVLPAAPASARAARRFVVRAVHQLDRATYAEVAELLVSELVTNALLHAGTEVCVRVDRSNGGLRVEVADASSVLVAPRSLRPEATTGRGLALVAELAASWGTESRGTGKAVWFELHAAAGF